MPPIWRKRYILIFPLAVFFVEWNQSAKKISKEVQLGKSKPLPIWGFFFIFKDEVFGTFELGVLCRQRTLAYEDRYHWNHCMMTFVISWSGVSLITENESYWTCYTYLDVTALPSQHFSFFRRYQMGEENNNTSNLLWSYHFTFAISKGITLREKETNTWTPKMVGFIKGKPLLELDDLGGENPHYFLETSHLINTLSWCLW